MAIALGVELIDVLAGYYLPRPFPATAIIPMTIPLLVVALIIVPMRKAEKVEISSSAGASQ
jgi:hypothetical protein